MDFKKSGADVLYSRVCDILALHDSDIQFIPRKHAGAGTLRHNCYIQPGSDSPVNQYDYQAPAKAGSKSVPMVSVSWRLDAIVGCPDPSHMADT